LFIKIYLAYQIQSRAELTRPMYSSKEINYRWPGAQTINPDWGPAERLEEVGNLVEQVVPDAKP